jgi:hypothetical protein
VFVNNNGTWSQQAYIKASNPHPNDLFGIRLAISTNGNVLVASSMLQAGRWTGAERESAGLLGRRIRVGVCVHAATAQPGHSVPI